ncbi:MAG: putative Fe-S cluster-containing radical SAM superfamily protein [Pseudohongiellaceae bacterium]
MSVQRANKLFAINQCQRSFAKVDRLVVKSIDKFQDPLHTADGEERAFVDLHSLETLWFNTGSLCNLTCANCYIESSPHNDRLAYIAVDEVARVLQEIHDQELSTKLIGYTGGEPFLNPEFLEILELTLSSGFDTLVLTNGFRRIERFKTELLALNARYGAKLQIRISLDHHSPQIHEKERGSGTFMPTMKSAKWLFDNGFRFSIAGRAIEGESTKLALQGYQRLLDELGIGLDAAKPENLVIFPEMDLDKEVPEITVKCWDILGKKPQQQMCASERMVVKRKGDAGPTVLPCTLLAYDEQFNLGSSLASAATRVHLNHKFCAQFCVLGGASCSSTA